jgi:outer membrane protein OmpA-like peptidoglycan-associated protein
VSTKKKTSVVYLWSGDGVTGNGATATVATAAQAPGAYAVKAEVKEGKAGKEGLKPGQSAEATANYTVKPFEPPTISCSVSPSTIKPGDAATVTANGVSPQNRPLTYSYLASAGAISGSGTTASFTSAGAPTGEVSITCNVSDDKSHSATAQTTVTITAPYVPPAPHAQALSAISFSKDKRRPVRVDNEAKASLDAVALELQKQSDAKVVLVGNSDAKEKAMEAKAAKHKHHMKAMDCAAERAVNTKDYLVKEKGIDPSRISVVTGTADEQTVVPYLVPAGADFTADVTGTSPVDEAVVMAQPRISAKKHHAKKAE